MAPIQYKFTCLNDIQIGDSCNVYGLVKYCSNPEKTKGKDFKMTISITDISLGYCSKLMCNLFNERAENLPRISGRGDVIIIHKLKINKYLDKPQGLGIQKQGYSVAVFSKSNMYDTKTDLYEEIIKKMGSNKSQFNITMEDLEKVQELMEWGYQMPSSEIDEIEVNLESLHFVKLSEISPKIYCSMAVQIVSVISIEYLDYRSLLLFWDGTLPSCELNKKFVTSIPSSNKALHSPHLMALLGGKLSNAYLGHLLMKEEQMDIKQSLVRPGDYVYLTRVSIEMPLNGPGVCLVADRCKLGILMPSSIIYQDLFARLSNVQEILPCVADCFSTNIKQLDMWSLYDYGKMIKQLETNNNQSDTSIYQFKIKSRVVNVHPSTEKEFYESIILYCTNCQNIKCDDSICTESNATCRNNLVPIPMVTMIFEDFTGWLTGLVIGKSVMDMLNLVMVEASQPKWWIRLFATKDKSSIARWVHHIGRLKQGWIEAKIVLKCVDENVILPFVEDVVILDY